MQGSDTAFDKTSTDSKIRSREETKVIVQSEVKLTSEKQKQKSQNLMSISGVLAK